MVPWFRDKHKKQQIILNGTQIKNIDEFSNLNIDPYSLIIKFNLGTEIVCGFPEGNIGLTRYDDHDVMGVYFYPTPENRTLVTQPNEVFNPKDFGTVENLFYNWFVTYVDCFGLYGQEIEATKILKRVCDRKSIEPSNNENHAFVIDGRFLLSWNDAVSPFTLDLQLCSDAKKCTKDAVKQKNIPENVITLRKQIADNQHLLWLLDSQKFLNPLFEKCVYARQRMLTEQMQKALQEK